MDNESLEDFNEAIRLSPQYAEAYCLRGRTKFALNQTDAALMDVNKSVEIKPTYAEGYYYQSQILSKLGRKKEALQAIDKALVNAPGNSTYANFKVTISN